MEGVAQSVNSIALQAEIFSKNGVIASPIFSDIQRQPEGVHFSLSALINPAAINYGQVSNAAGAAAAVQQPQQPAATPPAAGLFNGPSVSNQGQ